MKNVVNAITGSGFLIAGVVLIQTCQALGHKLSMLGFAMACLFIITGLIFLGFANVNNN
jgi:uncharacterized membrane protein YozB (DUF420 family)